MAFNHGLTRGNYYTTYEIQDIFKHNRFRGMRYSKTTNTLVLIIDHVKSIYNDKWNGNILYYTGMGKNGNQSIDFMQNKRLAKSKAEGTDVYVFEIFTNKETRKYRFTGEVELLNEPYEELQYDEDNKLRTVYIFPLILITNKSSESIINKEILIQTKKMNKNKINKLSYDEIKKRAINVNSKLSKREVYTNYYERNIYVSEYTKIRANGICDLCEKVAPFSTKYNKPYLETHHVKWLSKGGTDTLDNTVALCPNCHRKMHILKLNEDIEKLKMKIKKYC